MGINRSETICQAKPTLEAIYSTTTALFPVKFSKTQ
ncbi:hypothetical protein T10_8882 [Trichinella papuae]|uniref:Uncharacterized protein n=1 Tax=Trichinella papuae TaxID=268474 RepID=A0A0V1LWY8_9BILA|nr:hypothetical protein T10_6113 [Trichinella papuae]KRZ64662.1 hypothetical protein T10_8882 [Trichinella papuae]